MVSSRVSPVRSGIRLARRSAMLLGAGYLIRASGGVRNSLGATWRRQPANHAGTSHFDGKSFHNLLPSQVISPSAMPKVFASMITRGSIGKPSKPVPLVQSVLTGPAADLAVTWLGHASALLEIDGVRVLADPVWSERVSPSTVVGPKRIHEPPIAFDQLPPIDVIIISHDHYDHLDLETVQLLRDHHPAPFLVPIGVGEHLRRWGIPESRIVELDWEEQHQIGALTLTCVQARHFSGRGLTRNDTLWSSWALAGPRHRVFFGGDTGYTPTFKDVGERHGPFDLTLVPIGAYDMHWADIHLNPEEAVQTHLDVKGKVLLPIHWATFDLAAHAWAEPVERLLKAAADHDVRVLIPRPGQRIDAVDTALDDPWWQLA